jgi:hypothetical protein
MRTTAVAWLGCLSVLWLIARPEGVWKDIKHLALLAVGCVLFLIPYAYLLSGRSTTMDEVQLLVRTHAPDFSRFPEYISAVVLLMLATGLALKKITIRDKVTLFVLSLGFTPLVIFNQQVIPPIAATHSLSGIYRKPCGRAVLISAIGLLLQGAILAGNGRSRRE